MCVVEFLLDAKPGVKLLGEKKSLGVRICLYISSTLLDNVNYFFKCWYQVDTPTNIHEIFCCSVSSPLLDIVRCQNVCRSGG